MARLLDETVTAVRSLGLVHAGKAVRVKKLKLPKAQQKLDPLPLIAVCPSERQGPQRPFDSEGAYWRERVVVAALIAPGNAEPVEGLDEYSLLIERVEGRLAVARPVAVPECLRAALEPEVYFDRGLYSTLYTYLVTGVRFWCVEQAA